MQTCQLVNMWHFCHLHFCCVFFFSNWTLGYSSDKWKHCENVWLPQHQACPSQSSGSGPRMQRCSVGRSRGAACCRDDRLRSGSRCLQRTLSRRWTRCQRCTGWLPGTWDAPQGRCSFWRPQRRSPVHHARCSRAGTEPGSARIQVAWKVKGKKMGGG